MKIKTKETMNVHNLVKEGNVDIKKLQELLDENEKLKKELWDATNAFAYIDDGEYHRGDKKRYFIKNKEDFDCRIKQSIAASNSRYEVYREKYIALYKVINSLQDSRFFNIFFSSFVKLIKTL